VRWCGSWAGGCELVVIVKRQGGFVIGWSGRGGTLNPALVMKKAVCMRLSPPWNSNGTSRQGATREKPAVHEGWWCVCMVCGVASLC
jgi:hypothetical protein